MIAPGHHSGDTWVLGRRESLTSLRGLAILLVLLGHFGFPWLAAGGTVGVSLFFALSGYLITGLLLDEFSARRGVNLRQFYYRRARRLLPALLILMAAVLVWSAWTGRFALWVGDSVSVMLYVANWYWLAGHPLMGLAHTWSLAVEEQFYLLWPLVLLLLLKRGITAAIAGTLVIIALSYVATTMVLDDYMRSMYGSDVGAKGLLVGCLIALISAKRRSDVMIPTWMAVVAVTVLAFVGSNVVPWASPLLTALPCGLVVGWVAARPNFAVWRPLIFTGTISYGLYLYHFPLEAGPFNVFDQLGLWPRMLALFAASFALAAASYQFVERRITARHLRESPPHSLTETSPA
jgi:peptidoglycan/LPS O-acetylase OafA/YrhL